MGQWNRETMGQGSEDSEIVDRETVRQGAGGAMKDWRGGKDSGTVEQKIVGQ